MRSLKYSQHVPKDTVSILARALRLNRGRSIFPNLLSIQIKCWPLTASQSYLLFGPKLRTIDLSKQSGEVCSPSKHWGPLSRMRQQQLCIQLLLRRCPILQTCRCRISLGNRVIRYLSPEAKRNVGSVRNMHYTIYQKTPLPTYRGVVDLPSEYLERISRTEDLIDLHLNHNESSMVTSEIRRRQRSLPCLVQSLSTFSFEQHPTTVPLHRPPVRCSLSSH